MKLHQEQQALFRQDLEEVTRTAGEAPARREEESIAATRHSEPSLLPFRIIRH